MTKKNLPLYWIHMNEIFTAVNLLFQLNLSVRVRTSLQCRLQTHQHTQMKHAITELF